jgi:integrase
MTISTIEKRYTTPKLNKGVKPATIQKGSTLAKELAKNDWYISYSFNGKQVKVKKGLNRITDHLEKQLEADSLLLSIKNDLAQGYNPFNPSEYLTKVEKQNIGLADAIVQFIDYHEKHYTKKKTIQSYHSKLKALLAEYPKVSLQDLTLKQLENFIVKNIDKHDGYSHNTVKFAKRTFSTFFAVMIKLNYITRNTYIGFNPKIKSFKQTKDSHVAYDNKQLVAVMKRLDSTDSFGALFCRFVYNTLLRPSEIRGLKVGDINLTTNIITVRAVTKKVAGNNPENDYIGIVDSFIPTLKALALQDQNPDHYIFGNDGKMFTTQPSGTNTAYYKLTSALKFLKLDNKGLDLYSFKHTSNENRFNEGWKPSEIMKANRHTTINQTDTYLKGLTKRTDISKLTLKAI